MLDESERKRHRMQLRKDVALMRQLGVARWTRGDDDIFLGPPPQGEARPLTPEEEREHLARAEQRRHETLFAATSTRPVLVGQEQAERAQVLKSVVPRQQAHGHGSGQAKR